MATPTLYDILRELVDRAAWHTEEEYRAHRLAVDELDPATTVPAPAEPTPAPAPDPQVAADLAAAQAAAQLPSSPAIDLSGTPSPDTPSA